jgi:hypothetical protein
MNNLLKNIYYNPTTGYLSSDKFYRKAHAINPGITHKDVVDFLKRQYTYQINKNTRRPSEYTSWYAPYIRYQYQIDILDLGERYISDKYRYILTCVDVYSRYAQARPMIERSAPNILTNLQDIWNNMGVPERLTADHEFEAGVLVDYFQQNSVTVVFSDPKQINKNAIVERFHRTLRLLLSKWRQAQRALNRRWQLVLPYIIKNYNETFHRIIKAKPVDVWNGNDINHQDYNYAPTNLNVGDRVRIKKIEEIFDRIDTIKFSRDVYVIRQKTGDSYLVRNTVTGEEPSRRYKAEELQVIYDTEQQDDQDNQDDQDDQDNNQNNDQDNQDNNNYPDQQQLDNETRRQRRVQREQRRLEDTIGLNELFDENQPRQRKPSLKKRGTGFRRTVGGALIFIP